MNMTTLKRTLKTPNRLSYNTYGTDKEYIERLEKHLLSPLQGMEMMEGDMCMSDYRSLLQGKWLIENKDQ
jgi:hypothetical protein